MTDRAIPPQQGDEAQLFGRHYYDLFEIVRRAVRAPEAVVQDACSFAWLQFLEHQPRRDTVFPWLKTVAIREAWHLAARERRDDRLDMLAEDDDHRHAPLDIEGAMAAREALATVASLPDRQRRYFTLFIAGHSYDEIAAATSTSFTNVNKHLVRARKTLRHQLHG